ncbi:MAG: C40 family peptidase [Selenomonadaceae bacterium]|nr:C40 family peptidase [Selenomonadaceae bacterium]
MKIYIFAIIMTAAIIFSSQTIYAAPTLLLDSKGADVITLQEKLYEIGYDVGEIDGEFGNKTKIAVENFQRDQKITVTGVVNSATWRALKKAKPLKLRPIKKSENNLPPLNNLTKFNNKLVPYGTLLLNKSQAETLVRTAKKYIGVPYVFGGTTPAGFDCSGFLQYVFKQNGILIPRLADEQYKLGRAAKLTELDAGDLVFFTTYEPGASHCGIYVGGGQFLHTSSSRGVRIDYLSNEYWSPRFLGAKKIVEI